MATVGNAFRLISSFPTIANGINRGIGLFNNAFKSQGGQFNLAYGALQDGDELLNRERQSPRFVWLACQTHQFTYHRQENEVITYVEAYDNWGDGTGGSPKLTSGGPGKDHVTIEVTSHFNRGFDFTVSVHGRKRDHHGADQPCSLDRLGCGANDLSNGAAQVTDTNTEARSFHFEFGVKRTEDVLLYAESKSTFCVVSESQTHQCTYHRRRNEVITYVKVHDNLSDGTGGSSQITSGGIRQDHVTIEVTSQLGEGFDSSVSVYGRKRWYYAFIRFFCCRWCCCCFGIQ
ncbi:uncharacterized protein [Apostichopus japonicus]|uniref:uncharacterized protein n=1 Tax=Stichopus japonicus TaxID=307972 RepID=UPI003AB7E33A